MDKQTLSNYGWIVVLTLILAVLLALATPFGSFIAKGFKATYVGFSTASSNAMETILGKDIDGDGAVGGGPVAPQPLPAPEFDVVDNMLYINTTPYDGLEGVIVGFRVEVAGSCEEIYYGPNTAIDLSGINLESYGGGFYFNVTAIPFDGENAGNYDVSAPAQGSYGEVAEQIQLKPFAFTIANRYLDVNYEDGGIDENVEYYEIWVEGNLVGIAGNELVDGLVYLEDGWVQDLDACGVEIYAKNDTHGLVEHGGYIWYEVEREDNGSSIELKPFELSISDNILYITYADGELDPNVEKYVVAIPDIGVEFETGGTAIDLTAYDFGSITDAYIVVVAMNETHGLSYPAETVYNVPSGGSQGGNGGEQVEAPAAPSISIVTNENNAVLTINPVENAEYYEIYINGSCVGSTQGTSYTISKNQVNVGANEVYVRAVNGAGSSENSNVVTTGKLADPEYHMDHNEEQTQSILEFPYGDVANADGYIIYDEKGDYLMTLGLGKSFDFNTIYTTEGTYLLSMKAYADGWMSSNEGYIWVFVGEAQGGYGCIVDHVAPTLSYVSTAQTGKLTIVNNSTEFYDGATHQANERFNIYKNGALVGTVDTQLDGHTINFDIGILADGDVVTVKTTCEFEADNDALVATYVRQSGGFGGF